MPTATPTLVRLNAKSLMTKLVVEDDGVLNLPDDLLEEMGWKDGDLLVWEDQGDGSFSLRKHTENEHD